MIYNLYIQYLIAKKEIRYRFGHGWRSFGHQTLNDLVLCFDGVPILDPIFFAMFSNWQRVMR